MKILLNLYERSIMKLVKRVLRIMVYCIVLLVCYTADRTIDGFKPMHDSSDYHAVVMSQKLWTTQFVGDGVCVF